MESDHLDERPTHLDLFSGIGGFAIAAQWAGFRTIGFCEIDPFCCRLLKQHWPNIPNEGCITKVRGRHANLLTGGFPCQPVSHAGKRRGQADHRYLWPEMLRVISEGLPDWVLGENVIGLDGMGLDQCISDLESLGYEVAPPLEIPACSVGAMHERARFWIVANSNGQRFQGGVDWMPEDSDSGNINASLLPSLLLAKSQNDLPEPYNVGATDGVSDRAHRIKSLGNAIVPQVAYEILREIRKLI